MRNDKVQVIAPSNFAAPLANSLTTLSKSLLDQNALYEERKRLDANEKRIDSRNTVMDKRAAEELALRKSELNRARIKDERQSERADKQLGMAQEEFAYTRNKRAADRELSSYTNNPENFQKAVMLEQYAPEQVEVFQKAINGVNQELEATQSFLKDPSLASFKASTGIYKARLEASGMKPDKVHALVSERDNRLNSLVAELDTLPAEQKESRMKKVLDDLYTPQLERINESIASGKGMPRREQSIAFTSGISNTAKEFFTADDINSRLGSRLTGTSREALIENENKRVSEANRAAEANIDRLKDFYTIANKGSSTSRSKSGVSGAVKEIVALKGIGSFDDKDIDQWAEKLLLNDNISPDVAASVIALAIERDFMGDNISGVGSDRFTEMEVLAEKLSGGKSTSGGGSNSPNIKDFQYTPIKPRPLSELLSSQIGTFNSFDGRLSINPKFDVRSRVSDPATKELKPPVSTEVLAPVSSNTGRKTYAETQKELKDASTRSKILSFADDVTKIKSKLNVAEANLTDTTRPALWQNADKVAVNNYTKQLKERTARLIELQKQLNPQ